MLTFLTELVLIHIFLPCLELVDVLGDVLRCAMINSSGLPILVFIRLSFNATNLLYHVKIILIAHLVETLLHFYFVGGVYTLLL